MKLLRGTKIFADIQIAHDVFSETNYFAACLGALWREISIAKISNLQIFFWACLLDCWINIPFDTWFLGLVKPYMKLRTKGTDFITYLLRKYNNINERWDAQLSTWASQLLTGHIFLILSQPWDTTINLITTIASNFWYTLLYTFRSPLIHLLIY